MKSTRKGFTLVEIMVVLVIISVLMAAFTSSVAMRFPDKIILMLRAL